MQKFLTSKPMTILSNVRLESKQKVNRQEITVDVGRTSTDSKNTLLRRRQQSNEILESEINFSTGQDYHDETSAYMALENYKK